MSLLSSCRSKPIVSVTLTNDEQEQVKSYSVLIRKIHTILLAHRENCVIRLKPYFSLQKDSWNLFSSLTYHEMDAKLISHLDKNRQGLDDVPNHFQTSVLLSTHMLA